MKVAERDYLAMKDRDDCSSMKSLNIFGEKAKNKEKKDTIIDKEKDICDTISDKSFKSHKSGISLTSNFIVQDYISEEPSLEYDEDNEEDPDIEDLEMEEEVEKTRSYYQLELRKKRLDSELYLLTAQLAPWLDRFGRLLVDASPHIAMMGHKVHPKNANNLSMISILTNEGSLFSNQNNNSWANNDNQYPEQLMRYLNPQALNRNRFKNIPYRNPTSEQDELKNSLQASNAFLHFEVPVMLNPGELMNLAPRSNPHVPQDAQIHLQLRAELPIDRRDLYQLQTKSPPTRDRAIQTEPIYHFSHVATISERNGSDFDLGSFRGSVIDKEEKDKKLSPSNLTTGGLRLHTVRTASHIAVEENDEMEDDPNNITFRPSEMLSDFSNNSPDIASARHGMRGLNTKRKSALDPHDDQLEPSVISGDSNRDQLESPANIVRNHSRTVCFKINETDEREEPPIQFQPFKNESKDKNKSEEPDQQSN